MTHGYPATYPRRSAPCGDREPPYWPRLDWVLLAAAVGLPAIRLVAGLVGVPAPTCPRPATRSRS